MPYASLPPFRCLQRLCATVALAGIAALSGCTTSGPATGVLDEDPPAPHQLSADSPAFLRLGNTTAAPPVRIGLILPFGDSAPATRKLADAMLKAAQLALYDAGKKDVILMTADESGSPASAGRSARKLLDQGAEVLIGPLFAASAAAVAPEARDRGVPVISFSTDRSVAGRGVYLLSFQPQNEVERVVSFALAKGHKKFAALIPATAYGDVVEQSFRDSVLTRGGKLVRIERYNPSAGTVNDPAAAVAKSGADAILIPQGGSTLRALMQVMAYNGVDRSKVKILGTGVWDELRNARDAMLIGGWFAAPQPSADDAFMARYHNVYGQVAPTLAALSYDAVSLTVTLSKGRPYHRFTRGALTDVNGFTGSGGTFRFRRDGTIDRGLAVLAVEPSGFSVVSPAPATFQPK